METYNPSLQTVDNDESELSEEDYNTPTDVDTSEKEIVSTKLGKQAKRERERERNWGSERERGKYCSSEPMGRGSNQERKLNGIF